MAEIEHLSERELLLSAVQSIRGIEVHLGILNNRVAKVEDDGQVQALQMATVAGALGFGRWAFVTMLSVMMLLAAIAGVAVTVIVR